MLNHATSKSESNAALHIQRQYIQAFQAAQSQQVTVIFLFPLLRRRTTIGVGGYRSESENILENTFLKHIQVYLEIIYFGHFIF